MNLFSIRLARLVSIKAKWVTALGILISLFFYCCREWVPLITQTEQSVYFWVFIKLKIKRQWFFYKNAAVPF